MYSRYYRQDNVKDFSTEKYLDSFYSFTELLKDPTEDQIDGYVPFYTVVYVRSTGNSVIVNTSENKPKFYGVIKSSVQDSLTTVEDEALLSAKQYLENVLTKRAVEETELPFKSFPIGRGGVVLTVDNARLQDPEGAFMIMSVIVEEDYFNKLELKEGYVKKEFDIKDYPQNDMLTKKVAETFITVFRPKGGIL